MKRHSRASDISTFLLLGVLTLIGVAIFLFSIGIQENNFSTASRAASRGLGINFNFVSGGSQFTWKADVVFNTNNIGPQIVADYGVYHCGQSSGTKGEGSGSSCDSTNTDFIKRIAQENRTITVTSGTSFNLTHLGITCGRIQIDLGDTTAAGVFGGDTYDTGVSCTGSPTATPTYTPTTPILIPTATTVPTTGPGTPTSTPWPTVTPNLTPTPTTTCGNQNQACCSTAIGAQCNGSLVCSGFICLAPTSTPGWTPVVIPSDTPGVAATVTPTPTRNGPTPVQPLCKNLLGSGDVKKRYDLVFLPANYTDFAKFEKDADASVQNFESTNLGNSILYKFNYKVHTSLDKQYNVRLKTDPRVNFAFPGWDVDIANSSMLDCDGDGYVILYDAPKQSEDLTKYRAELSKWGNAQAANNGLYSHGVLLFRYASKQALAHELGHSIAGAIDEYTTDQFGPAGAGVVPAFNCSNAPATASTHGACPKWEDIASYPDAGCFAKCGYTDWYRPTDDSVMNFNGSLIFNSPTIKLWNDALSKFTTT